MRSFSSFKVKKREKSGDSKLASSHSSSQTMSSDDMEHVLHKVAVQRTTKILLGTMTLGYLIDPRRLKKAIGRKILAFVPIYTTESMIRIRTLSENEMMLESSRRTDDEIRAISVTYRVSFIEVSMTNWLMQIETLENDDLGEYCNLAEPVVRRMASISVRALEVDPEPFTMTTHLSYIPVQSAFVADVPGFHNSISLLTLAPIAMSPLMQKMFPEVEGRKY